MKDDILISIMEYCIDKDKTCVGCLNHINSFRPCQKTISKYALDLINRQKAEIERYKGVIKILENDIETAKRVKVIQKIELTNDDEIYRMKFPVIVPNEE